MYHVGVSNIFELLDDENDQEGKKVVHTTAKQDSSQTKGKTAPATKEQPKKTEAAAPAKATHAPRVERSEKRPRAEEGDRKPRERRPPRMDGGAPAGERSQGEGKRDNKERGFPGPRANPNKRTYDRKSGTGRGKEVKKGGGGRANWGKEDNTENWDEPAGEEKVEEAKTAAPATEEAPKEAEATAVKGESEEDRKFREEEERKKKEEEEKEAKQMTLDDWRKKQQDERAEKGTVIPELPAPRKAGEGVDKKVMQQWSKFTVLKKEEEEEKTEAVAETAEGKKDKKPKKQAVPVDSVLRIQPKRERRERREREGDVPPPRKEFKESPRPQASKRGPRASGSAPNVRDDSSFPALSVKA